MPKAIKKMKTIKKEEIKKEDGQTSTKDDFKQLLKRVSDDATAKINDLKKKFDSADKDTKNKIITGLSVVAAGLVVLAKVKKHKK